MRQLDKPLTDMPVLNLLTADQTLPTEDIVSIVACLTMSIKYSVGFSTGMKLNYKPWIQKFQVYWHDMSTI